MKTGESIIYIFFTATGLLLSCVAVQAGVIGMPSEPITIGGLNPVIFDHGLHRSLEVPCGECHHDAEHNPRIDKDIFSFADGKKLHCNNCHNKNLANTFLQSREEIFHPNCRTCHAVGINGNRGPRKCNGCHFKESAKN